MYRNKQRKEIYKSAFTLHITNKNNNCKVFILLLVKAILTKEY